MKLSFLGAAREVTGSCFLVEAANARFLVDCGMAQGGREAPTRNRKPFEFDPASVANGESRAKALELLTAPDVQHRARAMRIYHIRDGVTHGEAGEGRGVE